MPKHNPYTSFISRPEISFWVPILVALVSIVSTYGLLYDRVAILETKVDIIITNQNTFLNYVRDNETAITAVNLRVTALEARLQ